MNQGGVSNSERVAIETPTEYALSQNYPNPFNPTTNINISLPDNTSVVLRVYDILGRVVRTMIDQVIPAGYYRLTWDGTDDVGRQLPSGIYIYRLTTDKFVNTRKMLLMK
jgi:hypothetical protein